MEVVEADETAIVLNQLEAYKDDASTGTPNDLYTQ